MRIYCPVLACVALLTVQASGANFVQTNLVSDIPGLANNTDPNLKNPWGMSFGATSPFWLSDQRTNVSTLYSATGAPQALVVTTPITGGGPQGPTGQIFNSTASDFALPTGKANFVFATLSGTISGWNGGQGTTAFTKYTATDSAVYTGLALGSVGSSNFLYAADFRNGKIDVFNAAFGLTSVAGSFTDPNLPSGFLPYNVQNLNGKLYIEYAKVDPNTGRASTAANTGIVDVFDTNGGFVQRLVTNTHLDSPWGVTIAPATFAQFGGDVLVGNFGDGMINAFDPVTGAFLGTISNPSGTPIVNSGLWSIGFRAPGGTFDPNGLYFAAGINNEANGLFGVIQAVPEPSTLAFVGLAGALALGFRRFRLLR